MHALLVVSLLAACGAKSNDLPGRIGEVPGEGDAPPGEVPPGVDPEVSFWLQLGLIEKVDLLFMIDNSNSMREEQMCLASPYPLFVEALLHPPDEDGDGTPDWPAAGSMHVGVITSDMGTSGYPVTTCDDADIGDDGVLQNLPSPVVAGCDETYPRFLAYDRDSADENLRTDFECLATLGTGGCAWEQQLYAIEKALTVHAAPGAANQGFLRPDSLLAILMLTDEDDCSVSDAGMFGDDDSLGTIGERCFNNPELVRPVADFVASYLSLRARPDRLVVAGIVGVPPDLVALSSEDLDADDLMTAEDFEAILDDPRMTERMDYTPQGGGTRLVPSCDVPGLGVAFPPRRLVELIRDVDAAGGTGIVQSICQADWSPTMRAITGTIARSLEAPSCTSSPITDASGNEVAAGAVLGCAVFESRYDATDCEGPSIDRGLVGAARVCQVCQVGEGGAGAVDAFGQDVSACDRATGWSYAPDAPGCAGGKVEFTPGSAPDADGSVYLQCVWPAA